MKSIRGRIIRKLKSISTLTSLNPSLVFQHLQTSTIPKECDQNNGTLAELVDGPDILVPEIFKDVQEGELVPAHSHGNEKTELRTPMRSEEKLGAHDHNEGTEKTLQHGRDNTEQTLQHGRDNICSLSFSNKGQLLSESQSHQIQLDSKEDAVLTAALQTKSVKVEELSDSTPPACFKLAAMDECTTKKWEKESEDFPLLQDFEEKCPPGGSESVVFYTTSFRGIRKTFEDCSAIRFLLESFRVVYDERDISMHLKYREELWMVLGRKVVPPRLFIRGRHIGGADEVVGLHEQGLLRKLLQGIPLTPSNRPCSGCAGVRFVLCLKCNGSRKITPERQGCEGPVRCLDCNENGLVKCPTCS